jgi:hypothetical protein
MMSMLFIGLLRNIYYFLQGAVRAMTFFITGAAVLVSELGAHPRIAVAYQNLISRSA